MLWSSRSRFGTSLDSIAQCTRDQTNLTLRHGLHNYTWRKTIYPTAQQLVRRMGISCIKIRWFDLLRVQLIKPVLIIWLYWYKHCQLGLSTNESIGLEYLKRSLQCTQVVVAPFPKQVWNYKQRFNLNQFGLSKNLIANKKKIQVQLKIWIEVEPESSKISTTTIDNFAAIYPRAFVQAFNTILRGSFIRKWN